MPDLSAQEDVLSLAASASQFRDDDEAQSSQASGTGSFFLQSAVDEPNDDYVGGHVYGLEAAAAGIPARRGVSLQKCFFQAWMGSYSLFLPSVRGVPEGVARLLAEPKGVATSLQTAECSLPCTGQSRQAWTAFALIRELGGVISFLVQARRQVWLAQSPLTEACRQTLRGVPVVPGELFGSASDILHAGDATLKAEGFRLLLENRTEYGDNRQFLWRLARSYKDMYESAKDKLEKSSYAQKGREEAELALKNNSLNVESHKWFAVLTRLALEHESMHSKLKSGHILKVMQPN
ncbi:hypothetical protein GOODEAATRI_028824 [Goodea atripinnis]|uniref:Uncharacterized protein n=2 Tax=Goodeidae TaxID=28758 RepID=A0ABV0NYP5_9TELE